MPQDLLQIALEHHRAGRLQRAEAGYRNILDTDPGNPGAMHWIGVLAHQVGRADEAVFWLEQAAAIRSQDALFQHNLGQAYLSTYQTADAIKAFERAIALEPTRAEAWAGLGLAYLSRPTADERTAAIAALAQANALGLESAELHHQLGMALLNAGLIDEAIQSLRTAIEKPTDFPAASHHLALAYRAKGDVASARQQLTGIVERHPDYAPAWQGLAVLEGEAGKFDQAALMFRKVIGMKPDYAAAYHGLGHVLQLAGKTQQSLQTFRQALAVSRTARRSREESSPPKTSLSSSVAAFERSLGHDAPGTDLHYVLATVTNIFTPPQVPKWAVANLFDQYAETFDTHLREGLKYRVPELIAETVAAATSPDRRFDMMDLGCGTGLCGLLLRPLAAHITGVDIAPNMIEKTRQRGVYDHLEVSDLVAAMIKRPRAFDLLVAADVLNYVGDLTAAFEAAAASLRPGGLLIFSAEAGTGDRYQLRRESRRYTHSKPYLEHVARICGLVEVSVDPITVRLENGVPVQGYLMLLQLPEK